MVSLEVAFGFFVIAVLFGLTPGPDNLFVLSQSAIQGAKAGVVVTLGLCTGLVFHTLAVAFGVAALFKTSTTAFLVLKIIGACYLVYLAVQAFKLGSTVGQSQSPSQPSFARLYKRGFIMNIVNPKVSIFFLAFLPQFADASSGSMELQLITLGGLFIVATLVAFGAVAWLSGSLAARFANSQSAQRWLNRLAGTVFIGLAIKLALASR